MAATTGSIFDTEAKRIEEVLSKSIDTILPTMDPAWKDTFVTSQGVGSASELSRHFYVNKLYNGGFTGVFKTHLKPFLIRWMAQSPQLTS